MAYYESTWMNWPVWQCEEDAVLRRNLKLNLDLNKSDQDILGFLLMSGKVKCILEIVFPLFSGNDGIYAQCRELSEFNFKFCQIFASWAYLALQVSGYVYF